MQVEVDGVVATTATADVSRPDVAAVYPGYGPVHGFQVDVPATNGLRLVRVVALNVGAGSPVVLGVRQLQVGGNPFGNFEDVVVAYGRVAVAGWAIDPDTAGPTDVHVYVDGRLAARRHRRPVPSRRGRGLPAATARTTGSASRPRSPAAATRSACSPSTRARAPRTS